MAVTTIQQNNKLIKFTQEINREFVRENMFSPYMGDDLTAIIRRRFELKSGGEEMNIPLVTRLQGTGVGSGTLVGLEEQIDNYGMRVYLDWARHAVAQKKSEGQKDSADVFGEAKSLLSDWGKELQRDELIAALMATPLESRPTGFGTDPGMRVNGKLYEAAVADTTINTWNQDNSDRVMYGAKAWAASHSGALGTLTGVADADRFTATNVARAKRKMMLANPKIRPFKTRDGYEYYVAFAGTNAFRDLKKSLEAINKDARPREQSNGTAGAPNNPIYQDGDQIYDGVIVRMVPEISTFVTNVWTSLITAGLDAGADKRIEPVFFCGQQAAVVAWGQMAKPTFRKEDDYGFITGTGIEMAYGVAKMFKRHPTVPTLSTKLVQWGVLTGFFVAAQDT